MPLIYRVGNVPAIYSGWSPESLCSRDGNTVTAILYKSRQSLTHLDFFLPLLQLPRQNINPQRSGHADAVGMPTY